MSTSFDTQAFGRYYLVDTIAVGGMAEVFKAKTFSEGGFEKLLCIKRILQHLSGNDEFVEMFIDEAKISVELQHPNIVPIYDFGKIQSNYFIAMECVEGKDVKGILRKLAERRKLLPPEYAVYIAHETCKGLDYAHKKTSLQGEPLGIIHRDISPSNILVSYNGEVKIADFGIAKARISAYNTKDGVLKGKFEYMSPEQASGQGISPKSDIFCTGIILHEMLTGRRLFKTDSDVKTLEKIKAVDIKLPSALNPSVPARLDALVMRALSQDPADRFADAREMQTALMEYLYPSSPDITRESIDRFMQELFSQEIESERDRLDQGSRIAGNMYQDAPELGLEGEWLDDSTGSALTMKTEANRRSTWWLGGLVAVLIFALAFVMTREPKPAETEAKSPPVENSKQSEPAAASGKEAGASEADPDLDDFSFSNESSPDPKPEVDVSDENSTSDEKVEERDRREEREENRGRDSDRDREESKEDDERAGWSGTQQDKEAVAEEAPAEETRTVADGTVSVRVDGVPWATVFVDGKQKGSAPIRMNLSPGTHRIRVVYAAASLDESQTVTVIEGKTIEAHFSP